MHTPNMPHIMWEKYKMVRTSLRLYSALAILERQVSLVVEQFGAEKISLLLSGRLVLYLPNFSVNNLVNIWYKLNQ